MAVTVRGTSVAIPTSGATFDVTIPGLGTPKLARFVVSKSATLGSPVSDAALSVGMTDGSWQRCVSAYSSDNEDPVDAGCINIAGVAAITAPSAAVPLYLVFNSWITDGVRLNLTIPPSSGYYLHVQFIVDTDAGFETASGANLSASGDGGTITITHGLTSAPDLVFVLTADTSNDLPNETKSEAYVGLYCNPDGEHASISLTESDAVATGTEPAQKIRNNRIVDKIVYYQAPIIQVRANVRVIDVNDTTFKFETTVPLLGTGSRIALYWLAVRFGTDVDLEVGQISAPNTAGTVTASLTMSRAQALMGLMSGCHVINSQNNAGRAGAGYGAFHADDHGQASATMNRRDGADPSETYSVTSDDSLLHYNHTTVKNHEATVRLRKGGDVHFDFSDVDDAQERIWRFLAIGSDGPTGDGSATHPVDQALGSGTLINKGSGSATHPADQGAGSGTLINTGSGSAAHSVDQAAGSGTLINVAAGVAAHPIDQAAGSGTLLNTGSGSAAHPVDQGAGSGTLINTGSGTATHPVDQGAGSGTLINIADGVATHPVDQAAGQGVLEDPAPSDNVGLGLAVHPVDQGAGSGTLLNTGSGSATHPVDQGAGSGTLVNTGAGAAAHPADLANGVGTLINTGSGTATHPVDQGAGTGTSDAPDLLEERVCLLGSLRRPVALLGALERRVDLEGSLDLRVDLEGSYDRQVVLAGSYSERVLLAGSFENCD